MKDKQSGKIDYEIALLAKPLLPDDIDQKIVAKLKTIAAELDGEVSTKLTDTWGKRHLAYPIKKLDEGFYAYFKLTMSADNIAKFSRELKLMGDVLRFLIIKEDEV